MYEQFFGFSGRPFQLNPDPDFFFGSRGHKRAMAYLEYGLHQGEGFIVITGEIGAGKTTLLRNLLRRIPADSISAAQIVSTQVDADDLLRLAAGAFHIEHAGLEKSALLMRIEDHFRALHADGRRALLIVDEAQNLSPRAVEELRMLSNFQIGTQSLVQSFLVGQPEFREIMQRPEMRQLKQRVIASYHLGPLEQSETRGYIEHRLRHVGWVDRPSFTDAVFDRIFAFTQGVPRRINTLCDRLLLASYLAERVEITASDVDIVAAELGEELGGPSRDAPRAQPAAAATHATAETNTTLAALHLPSISLLQADSSLADIEVPEGPIEDRIAQLEERVALVEASTNLTYGVLKKVLRVLRSKNESVRK